MGAGAMVLQKANKASYNAIFHALSCLFTPSLPTGRSKLGNQDLERHSPYESPFLCGLVFSAADPSSYRGAYNLLMRICLELGKMIMSPESHVLFTGQNPSVIIYS
eukprot:1159261-Pelagomonas_calceolata.AAC.7